MVEQNPDVIFVVYMENSGDDGEDVKSTCVAKVMEDPSFASLDAVKNGRVYPIMLGDMYASRRLVPLMESSILRRFCIQELNQ